MQKLFHILVIPLALTFLLSTQGVLVFLHHCHHSGHTYIGLFSPASCDHSHAEMHKSQHCCESAQNHSCSLSKESCQQCCSDNHIFLKPEIKSLAGSFYQIDLNPKCSQLDNNIYVNPDIDFLSDSDLLPFRPKPPPKTGIFRLIFFHNLKIPEILS